MKSICDHYVSGSNRNNAGQIGYSEVFIMETIRVWGNHILRYNLLTLSLLFFKMEGDSHSLFPTLPYSLY